MTSPLNGLRIVEVSSFVAAPLCGLTLAQLGAEVIRVDPPGGAADINRWPVTDDGHSIYWTGLNRGKQSVELDPRSDEERALLERLITDSGPGGGILVTNAGGRGRIRHEDLAAIRPDVITVRITGYRDGRPGVDYTVNAGLGFPQVTGPHDSDGAASDRPVNHVLPAWDVACGLYAALSVVSAVRHRERTGEGAEIVLPLADVALAVTGTLGYFTEPQVAGRERPATGNDVYGTYGTDFVTADGDRIMVVALTDRHFDDLVAMTGTGEAIEAIGHSLGTDFHNEADRFTHRRLLTDLFAAWFAKQPTETVLAALAASSVLSQPYRSFGEALDAEVVGNPLFAELEQPGIGRYLAAGYPGAFGGEHPRTGPAPALGSTDPATLLRED